MNACHEDKQNKRILVQNIVFTLKSHQNTYIFQTPVFVTELSASYVIHTNPSHEMLVQPYIPQEISVFDQKDALSEIIQEVIGNEKLSHYSIWANSAKAMPFIRNLHPDFLVYDHSEKKLGVNPELEREMLKRANLILLH
jgi:hypothetical protein